MRMSLCFFLTSMLLLVGCGPQSPPAAQIVTRDGASFIVVEPKANYERVCEDGQYSLYGIPDKEGLRAIADGPDAEKRWLTSGEEISWSTIDMIEFTEPVGDISQDPGGDFCPGQPESIGATVRLKNGTARQEHLIDTTDRGIEGRTERGFIVIPIREIATLKMIPDQNWPWAKVDDLRVANETPTLRITTRSDEVREFSAPSTETVHEKRYGRYSLLPPDSTRPGLPVLIAGARIAIPWSALKQAEIGGERTPENGRTEARLTAHVVYADGHDEDVGIADGSLSTTTNGGSAIDIRDISQIDLVPKLTTK